MQKIDAHGWNSVGARAEVYPRLELGPASARVCRFSCLCRYRHNHDLRHTHASLLVARGWRPEQIKDRLGHGSIRTTIDTYGHLYDDHDAAQLEDLAGEIRTATAPSVGNPWEMDPLPRAEGPGLGRK